MKMLSLNHFFDVWVGHCQCLDVELDALGRLKDLHHREPLNTSSAPEPCLGILPRPQRVCAVTSLPKNPGQITAHEVFKTKASFTR